MKLQASELTALEFTPELSGSQLDRARPLREQIYHIVRMLILTGQLEPGGLIDEKAIAGKLDVSRTPVREAVKKLSDENLVDVKPQSGTHVATISRKSVFQAFLIRRALEDVTVSAAVRRAGPQDKTRLEDVFMLHQLAIERERFVEAIGLDDEFHRTIAEIADLGMLWRAIDISKAQLDRCRYVTLPQEGKASATLDQHRAIIDALLNNDETRARDSMRSHLEAAFKGIEDYLDEVGIV